MLSLSQEGHADNVSPAIYGGFQLAFQSDQTWITQRVSIPDGLQCVLFIPDDEMSTTEARAVLPEMVSRSDAVFNISRAAMLVNCFATSQLTPLRIAMEDRLHQQYRAHMFPFEPIIKAALDAGAYAAFLSGAGPTVLAITGVGGNVGSDVGSDTMSQYLAESVSKSVVDKANAMGTPGTAHIAEASQRGLYSSGTAADGTLLWASPLPKPEQR